LIASDNENDTCTSVSEEVSCLFSIFHNFSINANYL
jgi:hypothetical protein